MTVKPEVTIVCALPVETDVVKDVTVVAVILGPTVTVDVGVTIKVEVGVTVIVEVELVLEIEVLVIEPLVMGPLPLQIIMVVQATQ